jgi:L-fucose mutarotase
MLKSRLIHPEIVEALAGAGHGAKVLIADANYPLATGSGPNARLVYLNLEPGKLTAPQVLAVVADAIPVEAAEVMVPDSNEEPAIFTEFRSILSGGPGLAKLGRFEFYDSAKGHDTVLAIATGEQRIFANILLTIGVVSPP